MDTSTWISIGSAVAAGGSWVWAILQRNTAERALMAAKEANDNSTRANSIAERALSVSERGAVDAQKARLVEAAPRISVAGGTVQWPPLRQVDVEHSPGIPWESDYIFRTPREASMPVGLRYTFSVKNIGYDTKINVSARLAPDDPHYNRDHLSLPIDIPSGDTITFTMEEYLPLSAWIEQAEAREAGQPGTVELRPWVRVDDGQDEGTIGIVNLLVPCNGLVRVPDEEGSWRFRDPSTLAPGEHWPPTLVFALPGQTLYYKSKMRGEPLDPPVEEPAA
ncbi:hypothetical protein ACGFZP_10520 [Kitasatospora sp. NPDC048239]|uniref:hypothetical protein n=1 Tax=Kitasatospora sp. NPDC048239 TaxID=3364046 RepID=UPI0037177D86